MRTFQAWTSSKSPASPDRFGFTLPELLVVIVIVALVAATAAMRWSGVHHRAVAESAATRLEQIDQRLRQFARSRRTAATLTLQSDSSRVRTILGDHDRNQPGWESLGPGVRIAEVAVGQAAGSSSSKAEVPFGADGVSPTYAVTLQGPGQSKSWLLFAGVTGQMTRCESRSELDEAFQVIATKGVHAD